ncbi:hypothetical protein ACLB1G_22645 [Oxalobacteraceae bacterium A2-2]
MKPLHIAMGVALLAAAGLALFGDKTPSTEVAEAVVRTETPRPAPRVREDGAQAGKPAAGADTAILQLRPRAELVGEAGEAAFASGEGIFLGQNFNPPPPTAAQLQAATPPPPPPQAPPLPFTYIGKAAQAGAWEVYLARGDKVYVARLQAVIDGVYRVDAIAPPFLTLTYLPMNQVQQLNIGVLE